MASISFIITAKYKEVEEATKAIKKLEDQLTKVDPKSTTFTKLDKQIGDLEKKIQKAITTITQLENRYVDATKMQEQSLSSTNKVTDSMSKERDLYATLSNSIQNVLGVRSANIALYAKEQVILNELALEKRKLSLEESRGNISLEEANERRLSLIQREVQHKQIAAELKRNINAETKEINAETGSIQQLTIALVRMRDVYNQMSPDMRESPIGKELLESIKEADTKLASLNASMGYNASAVKRMGSNWNGLQFQVQQVARELPSLAVGINTLILAWSNNLPMLVDEVQKARVEVKALAAEGKTATPVWKQLLSSAVSWQTALVVAITLLSVYGKDITNWVKGLFSAEQAQKHLNESMTEFSSILSKEYQELKKLFSALDNVKEGTEGRRKAINDINAAFGKYLPNLLSEKSTLSELNEAYKLINKSLRENAALKAQGSAIDKVLDESIKKQSAALTEMRNITSGKLGTSKANSISEMVVELTETFREAGKSWQDAWRGVSDKIMNEIGNKKLGGAFYEQLEDYVRSVYDSEKKIEEIQKQFNPFFNKDLADKAIVKNKKYYEEVKKQAESVIESLEPDIVNLLRAGKTEGIDSAIVEKYREAKKAIDEATESLKAYDSTDKRLNELNKQSRSTNRINSLLSREDSERIKLEKDLQFRIEQAKIDAMAEGWEKTKRQMSLNHKKELSALEQQQNEYLLKIVEYERKKFEADPKNKGKVFDMSLVQLTAEEQTLLNKLNKELQDKQTEDNKRFALTLKRNQEDITNHFASELNKRLTEIDRYYVDEIKKYEGYQDTIDRLRENWKKERENTINQDRLNTNSFNQEIAIGGIDVKYSDTGMMEVIEREKTEILKKYAEERISILQQIGDEQSRQEIESLNQTIEGYNRILSKPKSIKQLFDEKIFKTVESHFLKTSTNAEEAESKTTKFFQSFSDAGQIASDIVGGLEDAFGGMSEELDMALEAVGNIAQGFASGGLIGGISAAAGQVIGIVGKLITSKKEVDKSMIEGYNAYIEVMDRLIAEQKKAIQLLGGSDLNDSIKKTYDNIQKEIAAARKLLNETLNSGAGAFSHSEGYKIRKMLEGYRRELSAIGINLEQLGGRADLSILPVEKLVRLQNELPEVWARLPEAVRKYLNQIIDSKTQIEELNQDLQDMLLGFSTENITSSIIDSLTDPSIDDAMGNLSEKMDDLISGIVKNIITKMALTTPITNAVNKLVKKIALYDQDGNIMGFKNINEIEAGPYKDFKDEVLGIGSDFASLWGNLTDIFKKSGIELIELEKIEEDTTRSAQAKGLASMSQDTGEKLDGKFTAGLIYLDKMTTSSYDIAGSIKDLTRQSYDGWKNVEAIKELSSDIKNINNRIADNTEDISAILKTIRSDTKGMNEDVSYVRTNGLYVKR